MHTYIHTHITPEHAYMHCTRACMHTLHTYTPAHTACIMLHYIALRSITLTSQSQLHLRYITTGCMHYITLHPIPLHYMLLHYITLHYTHIHALHKLYTHIHACLHALKNHYMHIYIQYNTIQYATLHHSYIYIYINIHIYITLHYTHRGRHYIQALHCIALH